MPTGADLKSEIVVLEDDLVELRKLQEQATRPGVHRVLREAIDQAGARVAAIHKQLRDAGVAAAPPTEAAPAEAAPPADAPAGAAAAAATPPDADEAGAKEPPKEKTKNDLAAEMKAKDDASDSGIMWQACGSYAWDQSDAMVKVYVDLPGVGGAERTYCHFGPVSFDFRALGVQGKCYRVAVHNLCETINLRESNVLVKKDKLVIRCYKLKKGIDWAGVDDVQKKKQEQHRKLADGGATTEDLLANMFRDADDKTRAELSQAAHEGRKKREAEAKQKGWA